VGKTESNSLYNPNLNLIIIMMVGNHNARTNGLCWVRLNVTIITMIILMMSIIMMIIINIMMVTIVLLLVLVSVI